MDLTRRVIENLQCFSFLHAMMSKNLFLLFQKKQETKKIFGGIHKPCGLKKPGKFPCMWTVMVFSGPLLPFFCPHGLFSTDLSIFE